MVPDEHKADAIGQRVGLRAADVEARMAFVRFVDEQYHLVVRFLIHNGAGPDDAVDATQAAFLAAWENLAHRPDQAMTHPSGWIRKVALNKLRRPSGRRKRPPLAPCAPVPEQLAPGPGHAELTVQSLHVLQILLGLDEVDRAVMAFCMDGFSSVEAAHYLDLTPQLARDALKRARRRLARDLARDPQQEGGSR